MSTNGVNFDLSLLNATQKTKFEKAKSEEEKIALFQEGFKNQKLNKQEKDSLREQGISEKAINLLKKMAGGEEFLNNLAYAHLETDGDNPTFKGAEKLGQETVKAQIIEFLNKDATSLADVDKIPFETLEALGLTKEELQQALTPKLQAQAGRVPAEFAANPSAGQTTAEKVQIVKKEDNTIALYRGDDMNGVGNEPTEVLEFDPVAGAHVRPAEEGKAPTYFEFKEIKDGNGNVTKRQFVDVTDKVKYAETLTNAFTTAEFAEFADEYSALSSATEKVTYLGNKLQAKQNNEIAALTQQATQLGATVPEELTGTYEEKKAALEGLIATQTTINKNKAAFTPPEGKNKIADVTLDEGESGARLHVKKDGGVKTRIHLYKDSKTDEKTGLPTHIAYSLGTNYGIKTPTEGQKREMWQDLFLGEDGKYHDRAKVRTFEAVVGDDNKVTLREVIDDKAKHDKDVKTFLDTQSKLHQAEAAKHQSGVEAVGGKVDPAKTDAVPWYEQAGVRDQEMIEQLKEQVGEEGVGEIADLDKKTPAQQIEALQGAYMKKNDITVPTGATAESLATEIGKVNGELKKMHVPAGEQPIAQGTVNGNAIALDVANQRLERAKANDTLFDDGTENSYKALLAGQLSNVIKELVVASTEEDPNPKYSVDGLIQTIEMGETDNIIVHYNEAGEITKIDHSSIYTPEGIDYDFEHFDYTGKVYDAGYTGLDAIIDKVKALGVPLEPKNIDPAEVFSKQTTEFDELKSKLEAQSVDSSEYTITEGRGNLNANARTISNMQNMLDRATKANKLYADNKAAIDGAVNIINTLETIGLAEETVTGSDGSTTTQPKQPTKVQNADGAIETTIDLKGGQKVFVLFYESVNAIEVIVSPSAGTEISFGTYGVSVGPDNIIENIGTTKDLPSANDLVGQLENMTLFKDFDFTTM